jgi:hypothetical protein
MIEWHLWLALHSKLVHFTTEYALMDSPPHSVLTFPLPSIISKKHSYTELLKANSIRFWWNDWWGEKAGFSPVLVHLPRVRLYRSGRLKFYMGNIIFNCMLVYCSQVKSKSSSNFSQVSVSSESEIFAFRSFCPISATTLYAPPNPKWNPPW